MDSFSYNKLKNGDLQTIDQFILNLRLNSFAIITLDEEQVGVLKETTKLAHDFFDLPIDIKQKYHLLFEETQGFQGLSGYSFFFQKKKKT